MERSECVCVRERVCMSEEWVREKVCLRVG